MDKKSVFEVLNNVDLTDKIKTKNGLKYLPWSSAWSIVKQHFPDSTFKVYPQIDEGGNTRFWHDDGRSGWVTVGVTIEGVEMIETLAIMDMRNKAISADSITSVEANKSMKRCLVKACALHGLGLYIFEGEDLPDEVSKVNELQASVMDLVQKKCSLSSNAKDKVAQLCKEADKKANPDLEDDLISGNPMNIDSSDILEELKKKLLAVRK